MPQKQGIQTPGCNTGSNCQNPLEIRDSEKKAITVRVDYIQFVLSVKSWEDLQYIADYVVENAGDKVEWFPDEPITAGKRYASSGRSVLGARFGYNPPRSEGGSGEGWLQIPGKVCAAIDIHTLWNCCYYLVEKRGARATRLDICADDWEKTDLRARIREAFETWGYECLHGAKKTEQITGLVEPDKGWTIYLGSRRSDKFVRYYDKATQSKGKEDCYRWEAQFRDEKANAAMSAWLRCPREFDEGEENPREMMLGALVAGAVDFRDPSSGDRYSRQAQLPWWADWTQKLGGCVKASPVKKESVADRKIDWLNKQVAPTFALLFKSFGPRLFGQQLRMLLESGARRIEKHNRALLEYIQEEFDSCSTLWGQSCSLAMQPRNIELRRRIESRYARG